MLDFSENNYSNKYYKGYKNIYFSVGKLSSIYYRNINPRLIIWVTFSNKDLDKLWKDVLLSFDWVLMSEGIVFN